MDSESSRNIIPEIAAIERHVRENPKIQGHICINNSQLFDTSVRYGIYGFPGNKHAAINNLKITAWRAISSLYNIGIDDLIFLYRTSGEKPGAQEFHGIFQVKCKEEFPSLLLHFNDEEYLPRRQGKTGKQYLPFRYLFETLTDIPISIPNDLRNKTNQKNNNLEIIKAFSEVDPAKQRLWGFRHPAVMNIGAARKKSIASITNKQVLFLLNLLSRGTKRPMPGEITAVREYDVDALPNNTKLLNDDFIGGQLGIDKYEEGDIITYEAELYAYIINALKNRKSVYHNIIMDDFEKVNDHLDIGKVTENVILEAVITPHIQEEIDILLCDSTEKRFLILEIKNGEYSQDDVEQAEKYIQLVNQRFPDVASVTANVIGIQNSAVTGTENVNLCNYNLEKEGESKVLRFYPHSE